MNTHFAGLPMDTCTQNINSSSTHSHASEEGNRSKTWVHVPRTLIAHSLIHMHQKKEIEAKLGYMYPEH